MMKKIIKYFLVSVALTAFACSSNASIPVEKSWSADLQKLVTQSNRKELLQSVEINGDSSTVLHFKDAPGLSILLPDYLYTVPELACSAKMKWANISKKPKSYNGVKFMLKIDTAFGTIWPQAIIETSNSDWVDVHFKTTLPEDVLKIHLSIGLEEVTGEVWFKDIEIKSVSTSLDINPALIQPTMAKTHPQARLRGAMIAPGSFTIKDLDDLHSWGANLMRWQLIFTGSQSGFQPTDEVYDEWLEKSLEKLDQFLPEIAKRNMLIALDLHSPPGGALGSNGYMTSGNKLWQEKKYQLKFIEIWKKLAARYKNVPGIWGFDLLNEPVDDNTAEGLMEWQALAAETAKAIREIDPERVLIVEPNHWGGVETMRTFKPIPFANVVYSPHLYLPHQFTHQGVGGNSSEPVHYPGIIAGSHWDSSTLRKALKSTKEFQDCYNVPIYIGEFSAIRWAPDQGAYRYLKDAIDLFEEYGWDWSYHAYREWSGWSVEHTEDPSNNAPATSPTMRQKLLMKYFDMCKVENLVATNVVSVYKNDGHNAFTSMASFDNKAWLVFRHAAGHVSFDGEIKIFSTSDGENFREESSISLLGFDLRDPKIVNAGSKLYLYVGAVDAKDASRATQSTKLYTSIDGKNWEEVQQTGLYENSWLWFVTYNGKEFYGSAYGRDKNEGNRTILLRSKDGINWTEFFRIHSATANEVALDTDESGALYALARIEASPNYPLYIKIPNPNIPNTFQQTELPFTLQGPFIKRMNGYSLVMGRRWDYQKNSVFGNGNSARHVEIIKVEDNSALKRLYTLPSAGDCSYPGWAELPDGTILISWYSGHESQDGSKTGIYVGKFKF